MMRNNVTFRHPAEFVGDSDDEGGGVLSASGAQWFADLLRRVPGLQVEEGFCQEDWGVAFFGVRNQIKFWIGLSAWDSEGAWIAHFHHGSFGWLQWFSSSRKDALKRLLADVHEVLSDEPAITEIVWYEEKEMSKRQPVGFPTPVDG